MSNALHQLPRLYFLTQDLESQSHADLTSQVLRAGVRWVQFRSKILTGTKLLESALEVQKLCKEFGALFVVNDYVGLALEINADGVHLGSEDLAISEARKILGSEKIIGGTCHTAQDLKQAQAEGASYAGIGPFASTSTKEAARLKDTLGIEGIAKLCRVEPSFIKVAIGGIELADVAPLLSVGCHGVAVCSAISKNSDVLNSAKKFEEGILLCNN